MPMHGPQPRGIVYRVMQYLDENGLATDREIAQHLGIPLTKLRQRLNPRQMARFREGPMMERVLSLTEAGREVMRRGAQ